MGWGNGDDHHGVRVDDIGQLTHRDQKIVAPNPHPPSGHASFHLEKDDGVVFTSIDMMPKKYGSRPYTPFGGRGNVTATKDDGGR